MQFYLDLLFISDDHRLRRAPHLHTIIYMVDLIKFNRHISDFYLVKQRHEQSERRLITAIYPKNER